VLESVGAKYLSLYGSSYDTTPHLVKEAKHALVFDNMNAHAPYTFCSFMAVNFSIYPGVPWAYAPGALFEENQPGNLPPTFASVMKQRGSRTAYLHNGDLEWGGTNEMLKGEGYDTVEDFRTFKAPPLSSWGSEDRYLFDRLIQFIDEKPGQPFLAYCWTDQTHHPYVQSPNATKFDFFKGNPPKELADELVNYLNVIRQTDAQLGRLFDTLRERGIADDTLVVITGDHGEAFRDPHYQQQHGYSIWQEEVNVPFILWNPRLFSGGKHMPAVGGHVDLNPTVADILGVEPPDAWQGHSLFVPSRPNRTFLVASVDDYLLGIREDRWKYVLEMTGGRELLYDLVADPEEKHNLLATDPARVKRMRQRLSAWIAFEDHYLSTPPPPRVPVALRQNTPEK
jgi:arylsulfatase A-like enzyme